MLPKFLEWIASNTTPVSEKTGIPHYPGSITPSFYSFLIYVHTLVLVEHNGSAFDFPILFAEVEQNGELATLNFPNNVHFYDMLPVLWKVKICYCSL